MNKYFKIVNSYVNMRYQSPDTYTDEVLEKIYNENLKLSNLINYDNLDEVMNFVKIMESSFMYPNKIGMTYWDKNGYKFRCPLMVIFNPCYKEMIVPSLLLNGVYQSRYTINICISDFGGDRLIKIIVYENDPNNKGPRNVITEIKIDGDMTINNRSMIEECLFKTILNSIYVGLKEIIDVYIGEYDKKNKIDEHISEKKGLVEKLKHLFS